MKLFILLLAAACNYKIDKTSNDQRNAAPREMMESVSFEQVKADVLDSKCIVCHGQAGGVNLESHASAHKHLDSIRKTTLEAKTMPKAPFSLTARQYDLMTAWIDAGGPDRSLGHDSDSDGTTTGTNQDDDQGTTTSLVTFDMIKKNIISNQCLNCHMAGGEAASIPFETKEQILNSHLALVVPGKPSKSLFYKITLPGEMNMMPPYPMAPLSKAQTNMIKQWIIDGAN